MPSPQLIYTCELSASELAQKENEFLISSSAKDNNNDQSPPSSTDTKALAPADITISVIPPPKESKVDSCDQQAAATLSSAVPATEDTNAKQDLQADENKTPLTIADALRYLDKVRTECKDTPQVYESFLEIMKDFKSGRIQTPEVIDRVLTLFKGNKDLIIGFNTFLPTGFKIDETSDPTNPFKVTISPTDSNSTSVPVGVQQSSSSSLSKTDERVTAVASQANQSNKKPVEFNDAIGYVAKVKTQYEDTPEVYKSFLEILQEYQKQGLKIRVVVDRILILFEGNTDLILGFNAFLPTGCKIEETSDPTNPFKLTTPETDGVPVGVQSSSSMVRAVADVASSTSTLNEPLSPADDANTEVDNDNDDEDDDGVDDGNDGYLDVGSTAPGRPKPQVEYCPVCFNIPNRAKLLTCCGISGNRMICSLCSRDWFKKHKTCPFCRKHIHRNLREHGLPDDKEAQSVIDDLEVLCPYVEEGCGWIGKRIDLIPHLKGCVIAIDPETGDRTPGSLPYADFALEEKWEPPQKDDWVNILGLRPSDIPDRRRNSRGAGSTSESGNPNANAADDETHESETESEDEATATANGIYLSHLVALTRAFEERRSRNVVGAAAAARTNTSSSGLLVSSTGTGTTPIAVTSQGNDETRVDVMEVDRQLREELVRERRVRTRMNYVFMGAFAAVIVVLILIFIKTKN
ncbi:Transcriptional regulatory protein sin3 [Blyttiomyces sp. JEL0837]|nr:Transcriptional regulatory protein sin3 [Blyttiomyces sp. JEL0837]